MSDDTLYRLYSRARLDDRQINELLGLSHGLLADGRIDQREAEYLRKWLAANMTLTDNPVIGRLYERVSAMLQDDVLDDEEASELLDTLTRFTGGDYELGELQKSTSLPFDDPAPEIVIPGANFTFTGTFAFGSRKDCERAVREAGGTPATITRRTDYVVVGIYATDSWAHSSFGRKIEKAATLRHQGYPVRIVGETDWVRAL